MERKKENSPWKKLEISNERIKELEKENEELKSKIGELIGG